MSNIQCCQLSQICHGCGPDGFDSFMMINFGCFTQIEEIRIRKKFLRTQTWNPWDHELLILAQPHAAHYDSHIPCYKLFVAIVGGN